MASNMPTRRAVMAAVGGAMLTGTAGAQGHGQSHRRETSTENGIVIQYEGCHTVHIRGNNQDAEEVVLSASWDDNGVPGTIEAGFDAEFPMTLTVEDDLGLEVDEVQMNVQVYDDGAFVGDVIASATAPDHCRVDIPQ